MKLKKTRWMAASVVVCFLLLTVTACKKTPAPTSIAAKQSRLDWNFKTTVGTYQEIGNADPKWDEPATNALVEFATSRSQSFAPDKDWITIIRTNCDAAVQAGCDDPMIRYLYIRFSMNQTNSSKVFADAFLKAAQNMQQSSYPSIRKFYAWHRAGEQVLYTYGYGTNIPPEIDQIGIWDLATTNLQKAILDKSMPPEEVYQACHDLLKTWIGSKDQYNQLYQSIRPRLDENWPNESAVWLLKGETYINMAWLARGGGYANDVTKDGWKLFFEHLASAESALGKAWQLNSNDVRIPILMIRIAEGRQKDRDEMELWFNRAMTINPNCYEACENKLHYLYPQWYGSRDAMVAFGRECVASTNWGGNVPLMLADAHREYWLYLKDSEEKNNYWKRPDVWPDIKAAFNRFFELNPNAVGWYHDYAWYAYQAGQWDTLNKIIPKLGPINYSFFGGTNEFDKMVQLAKEHGSQPK